MAPMKVSITRRIPSIGPEALEAEGFDLRYNDEDRALSRAELLDSVADAAGVLCMLHERVDEELLAAAPKTKVFSNCAVGYNNIDLEACRARGVRVTNTPGVLTEATADLAMTLLLSPTRRVAESDRY